MKKTKKSNRQRVILECTEQLGTSRYHTEKNKKNTPSRLELRKYNPILRRYTIHKQNK